jgi:hypothetical protein
MGHERQLLNMYENAYKLMVEASIAEILEKEFQYEEGLPTKFQLTKPKFLFFVDKNGCNTNQNDGGGRGRFLF